MREGNWLTQTGITEPGAANLYLRLHGSDLENQGLLDFNDSVAHQLGQRWQQFRDTPGRFYELDPDRQVQALGPESVRRMRAMARSESGLRANKCCTGHFVVKEKREHFAVQVVLPRCCVFIDVDGDFSRRPGLEHLFSVRGAKPRRATEETLNFPGIVIFRKAS